MWFAYLYRRGEDATLWVPDPDEVAAATTEAECVTGILEAPWDATYELGVDPLPSQIADIRPQVVAPVPRLFARVDMADPLGQTYEYVGVLEDPTAPLPLPPNPLPREPLEAHSVQAVHLLPPVGTAGQLLALDASQELSWLSPGTIALEDGSVTNAKLAPNAVTAEKIADGTITGAELAAGTITADKLAAGVIPTPPGAAADATPGLIAIETTAEVLAGTDQTKALTIGRLVARTATPTRLGLIRTAMPSAVVEGTNDTDAATPAGVHAAITAIPAVPEASEATPGILRIAPQLTVNGGLDDTQAVTSLKLATRLAAIPVASTSQPSLLQLSQIPETVTGTNNTHATTPEGVNAAIETKVPNGTARSVARYTAAGTALESTPGLVTTAAGNLGIGITPTQKLEVNGNATVSGVVNANVLTVVDAATTRTNLGVLAGAPGTALSVPRYTAAGTALEASPLSVDAAGNLRLGNVTPGTSAQRALVVASGVAPTGAHPAAAVQLWVDTVEGVPGTESLYMRGAQGVLTIIGTGILSRYNPRTVASNGISNPLVLTAEMSGKFMLANNGAEISAIQLPTPTFGVTYTIVNNQAAPRGTRVLAGAGNIIRLGASSTAAGGYVQSQTVGDYLVLVGLSGITWQALNPVQGWTAT